MTHPRDIPEASAQKNVKSETGGQVVLALHGTLEKYSRKAGFISQPIQADFKIRTVMNYVVVEKKERDVPTEEQLKTALKKCGGIPSSCRGDDSKRTLDFTGKVRLHEYHFELIKVVPLSNTLSWTFTWKTNSSE
ncbi:hypothetical protein [Herbaspirillum sp. CF444]|uniref:hypothetical protein n=1 Tax=Herbaspirillum sp. CF444 TaxID=1144319 RepID=UPI00138ADF43|nr:hypothetical protein [Herbaspirillum sp. CF444]